MRQLMILLVFLLSGAAGLIYQVVWMRQLTLIVGVTSQAVSTVLAVFMGGLAIGAWLMGRAGDESRSPLRFYGWLELGIALFGVQSLLLLQGILVSYADLKEWSGEWFPAVRFTIACAALLGPTILMGATLPVLIKGVCRTSQKVARDSGLLYGINTLGAVIGTLAAAFWLVENLGIRNTTFVAAGINFVVGLMALGMAKFEKPLDWAADPEPVEEKPQTNRGLARAVVFAFGVSGFLALAYEVLWTRYLIYVVRENSVFAFSCMLAAFLLGIAFGSFLAAIIADRVKNRVGLLGAVFVLLGAAAASTVTLMGVLYSMKSGRFGGGEFWNQSVSQFLRSLGVLIVPCTLSGSTFAIVAKIYAQDIRSLAQDAGRAYAINTLGAIVGAMAGGFLILPHLGLVNGLILLSAVNVVLGLWLLLIKQPTGRCVKTAVVTGLLAIGAFAAIPFYAQTPEQLLKKSEYGEEIVYYADGPESSIAVTKHKSGEFSILVDGEGQAGTDLRGQIHLRLLGHLPAIFHHDPKEALVVAYGAGITTGCVLQHPINHLDQVELNPKVIYEAAEFFAPYNHDPVNHPKFTAIIDDGRNFLLGTRKKYDVITSDPIDPNDAGTTSLYCKEYYELVRDRLNDGGLACQWITTGYGVRDFNMLVRTFQHVFNKTAIWFADGTTVVVGYKDEPRMTLEDLRAKFKIPEVKESLSHVGIDSAEMLLAMMVTGPDEVKKMVWSGDPKKDVLNTDDRPRIEYYRSGNYDWNDDREWKQLLKLRNPDHGDWLKDWDEEDLKACAQAHKWMDDLFDREYVLRWRDKEEKKDSKKKLTQEEKDKRYLERLPKRNAKLRKRLEILWDLIGSDVDRVMLLLCSLDREAPSDNALYKERMPQGLKAFQAKDYMTALTHFKEVAQKVPGSDRAILLSAACLDRQKDPLGALETLFSFQKGKDDRWDSPFSYTKDLMAFSLAAMGEAEDEETRKKMGERILALTPKDEECPKKRPSWDWWDDDEEGEDKKWPPRSRPKADSPMDEWRLWWRDVSYYFEIKDSRFVWWKKDKD